MTTIDRAYSQGNRMAWARILQEALTHLESGDPTYAQAVWVLEREAAVATLRQLCAAYGVDILSALKDGDSCRRKDRTGV